MKSIDLDLPMVRAYLELQRFDVGFEPAIHPDDEMLHFLTQVMGNPVDRSIVSYFEVGRELLGSVENLLRCSGRELESVGRALEFASGYGRLTRHLSRQLSADRLWVGDIQPGAMAFASDTFGVHTIDSSSSPDDVTFDGPYDLIVVISLFSHLPPHRWVQWLRRLYSLLSPDGILAFSVHDETLLDETKRDPSGFTFIRTSENEVIESDNVKLDLNEYGATYTSWPVIRLLAQVCGIQNVYRSPRDIVDFQDFIAVSREPVPGLERWTRCSLIRGCIDRVAAAGSDRARVSGWVGDVSRPGPVRDLQVHLDGKSWDGDITLGSPREDVAQSTERPGWSESGWSFEGSTAGISPGRHLLTATTEGTCFALEWHQLPPGS